MADKSHQKTPENFAPRVGEDVPKSLYLHSFKPEVAQAAPILKEYLYAYLDREIILVDGLRNKVVSLVPLPEQYVTTDQQRHGAAEPGTAEGVADHSGPTGSVPAYTSPETIR